MNITPSKLSIVGALGIVYGDIGTSPLYAFKKCFDHPEISVCSENILGIISLIFWSLFFIVSLKYVFLLLNADNEGEGGILSLTALCLKTKNKSIRKKIALLGIVGAALFYGDGVLTPAISVLGALEGMIILSPLMEQYIPGMAIALLALLFAFQKQGTYKISVFFGPIMAIWFITLGGMGIYQIILRPEILKAFHPLYAIKFIQQHGSAGILTCGAIVLVLTGAEALYADMGHFNKKSIRFSWNYLVFPALILNYLGQGALLLQQASALKNPFYLMVPEGTLSPLVILSTLATIIASQSVISGVFSLTCQAIHLNYMPLMKIVHTSNSQYGQIYIPFINKLMFLLTIVAVLIFRTSDSLASAYGLTITAIMILTTVLFAFYLDYQRHWPLWKIIPITIVFFLIDGFFFLTNAAKFFSGGWFPLSISIGFLLVILTWRKGNRVMHYEGNATKTSLKEFVQTVSSAASLKIPRTAIFICHYVHQIPTALLVHLEHNKYLHEKVIFISILINHELSRIPSDKKMFINPLAENIYEVTVSYGFRELPNLEIILSKLIDQGLAIDLNHTSFILDKIIPIASSSPLLNAWEEKLFILLMHNAVSVTDFYKIPHRQVLELGIHFKV